MQPMQQAKTETHSILPVDSSFGLELTRPCETLCNGQKIQRARCQGVHSWIIQHHLLCNTVRDTRQVFANYEAE